MNSTAGAAAVTAAAVSPHLPHWLYVSVYVIAIIVLVAAIAYSRSQFAGNKALVARFQQDPQSFMAASTEAHVHSHSSNGAGPAVSSSKSELGKPT